MNQLNFNLDAAEKAREEGIRQVAENNEHFLRVARSCAKKIAYRDGEVTCDDVRAICPLDPLHKNAWGAVFKTPDWQWTGEYRRSKLVQGHGNLQRVWKIRIRDSH